MIWVNHLLKTVVTNFVPIFAKIMAFSKYDSFVATVAQSVVIIAINYNNDRLKLLDEEEKNQNDFCSLLLGMCTSAISKGERTVWRHPASTDWWDHIFPNLNDELFCSHFRVDRAVFDWLVNSLHDDLFTQDNRFRSAVSVEKKVAVSLKCLATTCDLITVASLFGIGRSSVHKYFLRFVNAVYRKLVREVIKFPPIHELKRKSKEFEEMWGFPMAVAAIDGSHIPFNPPVSLATDFHNYKGWRSVIVVAMCDARGKALWLKAGIPGRMSDSGAFKQSKCYDQLRSGELLGRFSRKVGTDDIPYLILGDSGFAMENWLVKPFTYHGMLTDHQKFFNYRHSRARRCVENLFGRVKMQWRRLLKGLDVTYENAHKVISVCFALHNICEDHSVDIVASPEESAENQLFESRFPQPNSVSNAEHLNGSEIRDSLMEYFSSQPNPWKG